MSLSAFTQRCHAALPGLLRGPGRLFFVMGNEAADLDSVASSLALAMYLSRAGTVSLTEGGSIKRFSGAETDGS